MEKYVEVLLTKEIIDEFLNGFQLENKLRKLGDFENFVFEVYKGSNPYILRITHSTHRSLEEITSELDWIRHLHSKGISVPEVYPSKNGLFVESLSAEDGSGFFGCLYSKAGGEPVSVRSEKFDDGLFNAWGETIGLMHKATKSYKPGNGMLERKHWDEDDLLEVEKYYPADEPELIKNARSLVSSLHALPRNPEIYGVIHSDIHSGNFFYDGQNIHVFDFDDACYHWFSSDLAIPLYYAVFYRIPAEQQEERQEFATMFMKSFIKGYEKVHNLPEGWKEQLPLMLMLRDIVLYSVFQKKIAPEDRDERILAMMAEIRARISSKQPIVNIG